MKSEIFNYDQNWSRVLPIILEEDTKEALNLRILDYIKQGHGWKDAFDTWNSNHAPWELARNDYHVMRIDKLSENDTEFEMVDAEENEDEWIILQEKLFLKYQPKENEIEFYQLIGGCHWLADWQCVIAKKLFPNAVVDIFSGNEHSFAFSVENNTLTVFDILNFREKEYVFKNLVKRLLQRLERNSARK